MTHDGLLHFSDLKKFALSPAHYRHALDCPHEGTRPMRVGTGLHAIVLGGDVAVYDGDRRGKVWAEFKARHHSDRRILTRSEWDDSEELAGGVMRATYAHRWLIGDTEVPIAWRYRDHAASSRVDVIGDGFIGELKSTRCAKPGLFEREAIRLGYHAQLAFYREAAGHPDWPCYIVAVESAPPYPVTVWKCTEALLQEGMRCISAWYETLLVCEASGEWPGYSSAVLPIDAPEWMAIEDGEGEGEDDAEG